MGGASYPISDSWPASARSDPTGMLFVPSAGGRSHRVDEDTLEPQLVHGLEALAAAVAIFCEHDH